MPAPLEDIVARSHFIAQAFIFGDNKPHTVAILVPDMALVSIGVRTCMRAIGSLQHNSTPYMSTLLAPLLLLYYYRCNSF